MRGWRHLVTVRESDGLDVFLLQNKNISNIEYNILYYKVGLLLGKIRRGEEDGKDKNQVYINDRTHRGGSKVMKMPSQYRDGILFQM